MFVQFVGTCLGCRSGLWGSLLCNILMLNNHISICLQLSFRFSVRLFRVRKVERREVGHRGNDRVGRVALNLNFLGGRI